MQPASRHSTRERDAAYNDTAGQQQGYSANTQPHSDPYWEAISSLKTALDTLTERVAQMSTAQQNTFPTTHNPLYAATPPSQDAYSRHAYDDWARVSRFTRFESFSGDGHRVRPFVAEVDRFLRAYGHYADYEGYLYIMTLLTGSALECVTMHTTHLTAADLSWHMIRDVLLSEFEHPSVEVEARKALLRLRQTGTLMEYISSFRRLVYQLPNLSDPDQQFYFREHLDYELQRLMVTHQKFNSVQELIAFTCRLDSGLKGVEKQPTATFAAFEGRPRECWTCRSPDHYKADCPHISEPQPQPFRPHRQGLQASYPASAAHAGGPSALPAATSPAQLVDHGGTSLV